MSSMLDAIKARKQKMNMPEDQGLMAQEGQESDEGPDLMSLVESLSPDQKSQLKEILNSDSDRNEMAIAKGGASSEETAQIQRAIKKENIESELEGESEEGEDDVAKSMLDSRQLRGTAPEGAKPRNLGERMKMSLAEKLKSKGKI